MTSVAMPTPGTTSATITIPLLDDSIEEPTETFHVNLIGATNVTVADNLAEKVDHPVTVNYSALDGTAQAGVNDVAAAGTVTLPVGSTRARLPG